MHEVLAQVGDLQLRIETGDVARQASGSVLLTCGETVLLAVVTALTIINVATALPQL